MNGWIKLHRQFLDWEWYSDHKVKSVFLHCLLMANIEDKQWRGNKIKRGSFITSLEGLSHGTKLSIRSIRTVLEKLKSTNEIDIQTTSQFTVITICKYNDYQAYENNERQTNDKRTTNERQTNDKRTTTTKEYKNKRSKEKVLNNAVEKSPALYTRFMSSYNEFILKINGTPARHNATQGKNAKEIISFLKNTCLKKNPESGYDEIINSWNWILERYQHWDAFYKNQLELKQINSNLTNIINNCKNGINHNKTGKQPATSFEDIERIAEYVFNGNVKV